MEKGKFRLNKIREFYAKFLILLCQLQILRIDSLQDHQVLIPYKKRGKTLTELKLNNTRGRTLHDIGKS